jgi:hypothetical protein
MLWLMNDNLEKNRLILELIATVTSVLARSLNLPYLLTQKCR